jgi:phosphotransferase system HPr (HPr) family protein
MRRETVRVVEALHARPLDRFVQAARRFSARVRLRHGVREADAKNVVELLLLAVPADAEVTLTAEGEDEAAALAALLEMLRGTPPAVAAGELRVVGLPGAPGTAAGRARRERAPTARGGPPAAAEDERRRLEQALATAEMATAALINAEDPFSDIFHAQRTLLEDPSLRTDLVAALAGVAAEQAVSSVFAGLAARFDALGSAFASERHSDVADIRDRLLEALGLAREAPTVERRAPLVLIVAEATPSRLATLDRDQVAAVISLRGGPTSHAAIVARGRGVPLVFAPAAALGPIADGQWLLVNGDRGTIEALSDAAAARVTADRASSATPLVAGPTRTSDGQVVTLRANLGAPGDLAAARQAGSDGCGLLRSELLFVGRAKTPSIEEQAAAYARIARALAPHPTVVRLFDAGPDKPLAFLPLPPDEPRSGIGLRGLRLLLRHPEVLEGQLAAIGAARRDSGCDLRALVPMVVDSVDLVDVRRRQLAGCPLGAMIETPAAAVLAEAIVGAADFISIGTNDLAQYTLARDRLSGEQVGLHPAVLQLVARVARAAAAAGVSCSVCGDMASDPSLAVLLVGLGVRVLSAAPAMISAVREAIGRRSLAELQRLADRALTLSDPALLERLVRPQEVTR